MVNQGVGRAHLGHHREANRDEERRRDPERTRQREQNQAGAEDAGRDGYPTAKTNHALPRGESQGSNEGARARKAHENTKAACARVENVIGEDRHEHGVRHAGKTD
jgi:hypothetical protein